VTKGRDSIEGTRTMGHAEAATSVELPSKAPEEPKWHRRHVAPSWQTLRFVATAWLSHPRRSADITTLAVVASFLEAIGLATFIPIIQQLSESRGAAKSELGGVLNDAYAVIGGPPSLGWLLTLVILIIALKSGISLVIARKLGFASGDIAMELRNDYLRSIVNTKWTYFTALKRGQIQSTTTMESRRVATGYIASCQFVATCFQVAVYLVLSALISWQVTVFGAAFGLVSLWLLSRFVSGARQVGREETRLRRLFAVSLIELLDGMKSLKAMGAESRLGQVLTTSSTDLRNIQRRLVMLREWPLHLQEILRAVVFAVGVFVIATVWPIGIAALIVLVLLFLRTSDRIARLQRLLQDVAVSENAAEAYRRVLAAANEQSEHWQGQRPPALETGVELRNVTFSYGGHSVLDGASMTIPVRHLVAVTGPSGVGKTTVADLLIGLVSPTSGSIELDGVPLDEIDIHAWRSMLGYVPQHTYLSHDTIHNNVSLNDDRIAISAIEEALKLADAWDFVTRLPKGVDTVVGERGEQLSGGQRQRLAIARALVRKPKLLILDEATSALDPGSEREILTTLLGLKDQLTILFVTHRSSVLTYADLAYELCDGKVRLINPAPASRDTGVIAGVARS
jgi:ATP-binding cassette subfamily C protein